jgi:hypothetical protein
VTRPTDDARLRDALRAMPRGDPTDAEVSEVLRRAAARHPGPSRRWAAAVAIMVVALAVLALPPGRSAVASVVGGLQGFFQGGAAPGGGGRPPLDIDVILDDVAPGTSRVLATRGDHQLVGYRQTGTGWPCLGLGSSGTECADGHRWATRTAGHAVVALGMTVAPPSREVVVWGLAEDGVATVDLIDAQGRTERATLGTNAFLVVITVGSAPRTLIARDHSGLLLERSDVSGLRRACVGGGPCR